MSAGSATACDCFPCSGFRFLGRAPAHDIMLAVKVADMLLVFLMYWDIRSPGVRVYASSEGRLAACVFHTLDFCLGFWVVTRRSCITKLFWVGERVVQGADMLLLLVMCCER